MEIEDPTQYLKWSVDAVLGAWSELIERLDATDTVVRWSRTEPNLAGIAGLEDLRQMLNEGCDLDRADDVVGALVRQATRDDGDDAVLVLLHLLAPGVLVLAHQLRGLSDSLVPAILAELACQIRSFPWQRRTRAYAKSLLLDTKNVLWRETAHARRREQPVDPHADDWELRRRGDDRAEDDVDLMDMLLWAARTGLCPPQDLFLLLTSERVPPGPARRAVAAEFGLHDRALRRRRHQTISTLRDARDRYLQAA